MKHHGFLTTLPWTAALLLCLLSATPASARTVYYAVVCDSAFNTLAKNAGYPACSDWIREKLEKTGIKFITDNTTADSGGVTYYLSGSWSSPAAGSLSSVFLESLDNYSSFEEQSRWHYKLGFTGKRMANLAGGSFNTWTGGSLARNVVVSYYETDGSVNGNWATTALHELTHLLREDGYHHSDDLSSGLWSCAMDPSDYSSGAEVLHICSYCRDQVNRIMAGWTSLTGGGGPASLGAGYRDTSTTPGQRWRWAAYYWGLRGIDDIRWEYDAGGAYRLYAIGYHGLDAAEYRMQLGDSGSNNDLGLRGKADRPGPVVMNVYTDGHHDRTFRFDNNNNNYEEDWRTIHHYPTAGPSYIAIEFAVDYYTGPGDGDRNLYLEGLGIW